MFPATFTALYDACVLYPAPLRDLLLELATSELFKARWSEQIHQEWIKNLLKNRPELDPECISRTRELMDQAVDDCLISGYESLIDSLSILPDPKDRHILAAAIKGRADVIITYNLKDFPVEVLNRYEIEVQHPDTFIKHIIDLKPEKVCLAVKIIRRRLRKPQQSTDDYLMTLAKLKLPQTIEFLANRTELI